MCKYTVYPLNKEENSIKVRDNNSGRDIVLDKHLGIQDSGFFSKIIGIFNEIREVSRDIHSIVPIEGIGVKIIHDTSDNFDDYYDNSTTVTNVQYSDCYEISILYEYNRYSATYFIFDHSCNKFEIANQNGYVESKKFIPIRYIRTDIVVDWIDGLKDQVIMNFVGDESDLYLYRKSDSESEILYDIRYNYVSYRDRSKYDLSNKYYRFNIKSLDDRIDSYISILSSYDCDCEDYVVYLCVGINFRYRITPKLVSKDGRDQIWELKINNKKLFMYAHREGRTYNFVMGRSLHREIVNIIENNRNDYGV